MHSHECKQRYLDKENNETCWTWPRVDIDENQTRELLSVAMEIAVKFFWENFSYTFNGENYIQNYGSPIEARLSMCIAHLIMQAWSANFSNFLFQSIFQFSFAKIIIHCF